MTQWQQSLYVNGYMSTANREVGGWVGVLNQQNDPQALFAAVVERSVPKWQTMNQIKFRW